jgi:alpha-N-arabinofuranosidase
MQAHNTFSAPDAVRPAPVEGLKLGESTLTLTLPARSVVIVELR